MPKDADHLRSFLGMCSFYKKFVPDYSNLVAPLFELLHKNSKFIWSEECNKNFELLKEKLQKSPVLISPDFKKLYINQTDASNKGLATLSLKKWTMNYDPSNLVVEFYVTANRITIQQPRSYLLFIFA